MRSRLRPLLAGLCLLLLFPTRGAMSAPEFDRDAARSQAVARLIESRGKTHEARIGRGVDQALAMWRPEDGDVQAFVDFAAEQLLVDPAEIDDTFAHLQYAMEMVDGHFVSMSRELRHYMEVDTGPVRPVDRLLGAYDPSAHVTEDLFGAKVAFVSLLNFPTSTLQERLQQGPKWTRRRWAEARLVGRFEDRVPPEAQQALAAATARADAYVADYNLYLHHWLTADGKRPFPPGLRLISHWGLRDELKSHYGETGGVEKQRLIATVMERIVRQEIPAAVVNNPLLDWKPETGDLSVSSARDAEPPPGAATRPDPAREPDTRYRMLLDVFQAERQIDPHTPVTPTAIARSFDVGREIPVARVRAMLEALFKSPVTRKVAALIEARLGRELEPFDIWYAGFKPRAEVDEAQLDAITRKRYPTSAAFAADIPRILHDLGFADSTAQYVAAHVVVDPSRGAGHALGAGRRDDSSHLRTRVGPNGMDYKGYNIAIHELGHNVEQVFSLDRIDYTLLQGVPGNSFTEALAFVFQGRDLDLLGVAHPSEEKQSLLALESFWGACEIGAVGLVDIGVWEWMYAHPECTPAELREATVRIAAEVWDRTFAPLMHGKKSVLLGIYSHMLAYPLYLADYPLGHMIAFQLEEHFRGREMAQEFERVARIGRLTPDLWMMQAVGKPLGPEPLLQAAERAVKAVKTPRP
jgi:hypothetical protein